MKLSNGVKVFLVTMVCILAIANYQMFVGLKGENFPIEVEPTVSSMPIIIGECKISELPWPIEPTNKAHPINLAYGDYDDRLHDGIDILCEPGADVLAVESGWVIKHGGIDNYDEHLIIRGEGKCYAIAYVHIIPTKKEGDHVEKGEQIGDVIDCESDKFAHIKEIKEYKTHLHFSIRNSVNIDQAIVNPLFVLDPTPNDTRKPVISGVRFRENEKDEWWDHNNYREYMDPNDFLDHNNLHGKIDIVVDAYDFNIGEEKGPMYRTGVYKIGYKIVNSSGSIVDERILIVWNNEKWNNEPLLLEGCQTSEKVKAIYEQPKDCISEDTVPPKKSEDYPWTTLLPQHRMWYIVTNTSGSGKIQDINRNECWDTREKDSNGELKYPNGKYVVRIQAWDANNNKCEYFVWVTVKSPWYDTIFNFFDKIKNFFTETVPNFFRDLLPSEDSVEEKAIKEVKKDLDMLSNSLNLISELQKSFYEFSEEEIPEEYLQFEFKYTIQGAKFFQNINDAKSYMDSMDIGSYDMNDAISIVTEFGLEQLGFCIVVVDFYVNIAGDVEEGRYPVVCDEKGIPFWESWHLYEYIEEMYEETQRESYNVEHYEAEQLVLENQDLRGTRLRICIRNPGTSDAIIIAVYRNGTFVATINKTLRRNSVTCFDLPGTYYVGDEVMLVTEEGTQLKFKVK